MKAAYQNQTWPFRSFCIINYTFSPHLHNQIEIVYVLSGSCVITIEDVSYIAERGDLALIFPYQLHNFSDSRNCELIVQVFEPDYATAFIPHLDKCVPQTPFLKNLPKDCIDAFMKSEYYYKNEANLRIVRSYVSLYMSFIYEKVSFKPSSAFDYHNILHALLIYIDSHITQELSLDILSRELNVTKYYISRLFNLKLHTTFSQYINHLRLEYAINLLKNTNMTISNIAYESGFECERSFFRVFKKTMNITPLQYRKSK